ncbi:MAG: ABC transporter substrate-binding protein [Acidimicrobiia bacterium]|nr:ABC transporter substrate-binding protein [Acidimicrobiia bacterium]
MFRKRSLTVLLIVLVLVVAACGGTEDTTTTAGAATATTAGPMEMTEVVVLAPNPSAVIWFQLCSAIYQGFLEEEGIDASFEAVDGSGAVLQAMAAGQAEFGIPGPGPLLGARAAGEDPVAIYNGFAQALFGLVVLEDSDYKVPADLKGTDGPTVIGVGTAEGSEVTFVRPILNEAGLEEGVDYEFLPVGDGGPATAAFERGEIEAYAAAVPDMAIIEARGLPLLEITPPEYKTVFGNGYATTQSLIDSDPDLVQGFVNGLVKGALFAEGNPDAAEADCAQMNPEEATDPELARALLDLTLVVSKPLGGLPWGTYDPQAWADWGQSLVDDGTLDELPDTGVAFTNEYVEKAHANAGS